MSLTKFFTFSAILVFTVVTAQNSLIMNPNLSPDGSELAFSYQGDIWTYNLNTKQAKRLTIHEGYESNPIWSKNGQQIAFSSNRKGANNIFITS